MIVQTPLMTAEELERLPSDEWRYELIEGVLHKMAAASYYHAKLANRFAHRLTTYVEAHQLGEVSGESGWVIATTPDTVRIPDAAFLVQQRVATGQEVTGFQRGAPDLVLEVISPNDSYSEVAMKVDEWLGAGPRMVVVIDPRKRRIRVHRPNTVPLLLTEADTLDGGDVVPGWQLPVREIFA